jgi:S1-C subfamily serine protease
VIVTETPVPPATVPPDLHPAVPVPRPRHHRLADVALGAFTTAAIAAAGVYGYDVVTTTRTVVGQASPATAQPAANNLPPYGGSGTGGRGGQSGPSAGSSGTASTAQQVGVVDIDTTLGYQQAAAAGTGMILTSSGEVLTNNHVVDGATSITVTVVSTGTKYQATVVGTDPTDDVAVIQLQHASGLKTVSARSSAAQVGEAVTAVGNAGGDGGTPSAATGQVTAVDRTITASDQSGGNPEQLTGLIETNAAVEAGDSGGPLYDSSGKVIGMDTAASSGRIADAYAIPIATALSIAKQIESGTASESVHIGYPAFIGVSVQDGNGGAQIAGVASGTPAAQAGLTAGDVITAIDGQPVTNAADLKTVLSGHQPGQRVTVTWTDSSGSPQSATVTLATGPAD